MIVGANRVVISLSTNTLILFFCDTLLTYLVTQFLLSPSCNHNIIFYHMAGRKKILFCLTSLKLYQFLCQPILSDHGIEIYGCGEMDFVRILRLSTITCSTNPKWGFSKEWKMKILFFLGGEKNLNFDEDLLCSMGLESR